jgi:hypothetical protein
MLQLYGWNGRLYHRKLGVGTIKGWKMLPSGRACTRWKEHTSEGRVCFRMGEKEMSISTPLR